MLPVIVFLALSLVTLGEMALEHLAAGQAAENAVNAWASTNNPSLVSSTVDQTLSADGFSNLSAVSTKIASEGSLEVVTVQMPVRLLSLKQVGSVVETRSIYVSSGTGTTPPPGGSGGGGGGGGIILHHFPMW
ncbi:hypothetical protein TPY_1018 [Sulfobacillus acidophilus TPY]|nr:hypothetical protein TPY_1018 [Sulfobacillus acidophilus TPY]